eukprot:s69_g3.t1
MCIVHMVGVPPSSFMMNYVAGIVADIRKGPESKAGMEAVMSKSRPKWADNAIVPRGECSLPFSNATTTPCSVLPCHSVASFSRISFAMTSWCPS